ncbi:unnamed protein product [Rotaria sp. Silwood1]|nr:unnamed protein product [Rotaria sp. Silwood1]
MFNSSAIVNYLNMNYVVWTLEAISNSDIHTLENIWEEVFSARFIDKFSIEKCPSLIGITRKYEYETNELTVSKYQYETLVKANVSARTKMIVNHDILFNELTIFKEKFDENEQNLSFNFVKKTGLCWDVILEIARYLSINDAISAFSIRILFLLQNNIQSKFQLSIPFGQFIKIILPKINNEKIISLQLKESRLYSYIQEEFLSQFKEVISVSLHDLSHTYPINNYMRIYPKLTRLSLSYDNEVRYDFLNEILDNVHPKIKRFEIHCSDVIVNRIHENSLDETNAIMTNIEYFLLDIGHYRGIATNRYLQYCEPFYFITRIKFLVQHECEQCLDGYLIFFPGSLKEACQAAFGSTLIQERRPLLVYVHNDGNLFKTKICETMFNSSVSINYLNGNYVIWPCDVTSNLDIHTLANIWKETFSTQFIDKFFIEKCPLLIGIMRLFEYERDELTASEYQFETFVKGNTLVRTKMTVNCDNLCNELNIFKEKCDKNEQNLSFNFVRKTRLCWDIILEIAKYLPINDAISAFSIRILFLLQKPQSKFQLSNLYDPFTKIILPKINKEQIISLQLKGSRSYFDVKEDFLSQFREVVSSKIKRFEIHCPGIFGNQINMNLLNQTSTVTTSVEYFLFDIGHYRVISTNEHLQHYEPFVFLTKIGFISKSPAFDIFI